MWMERYVIRFLDLSQDYSLKDQCNQGLHNQSIVEKVSEEVLSVFFLSNTKMKDCC